MKKITRKNKPESLRYRMHFYYPDEMRTSLYLEGKLLNRRGCICVEISDTPENKQYVYFSPLAAKSYKGYTEYLNEYYSNNFTDNEAIEHFQYLTVKGHKPYCSTNATIGFNYQKKRLGELLKRCNPTEFLTGYSKWMPK